MVRLEIRIFSEEKLQVPLAGRQERTQHFKVAALGLQTCAAMSGFACAIGIQAWVLMFAHHIVYPLSHHLRPMICFRKFLFDS